MAPLHSWCAVAGSARAARSAALVVAGDASSPRPRGALQVLDASGDADAALDATELEADVGAWRELWGGALDALRREPTINNTEEVVVVQLGAVAFLHCPVRNLGERGVSIPSSLTFSALWSFESIRPLWYPLIFNSRFDGY